MPGVNDMTFNQLATTLNSIVRQATGINTITPTNTAEFVSVGTTALNVGTDALFNTLTNVIGRTIFANRPYNRKFQGIEASQQRWGYINRKISISDRSFENDDSYVLTEGGTCDPWTIKKANLIEEKFYGTNVFQDYLTIPTVQLRSAFTNPGDFAALLDLMTTNMQDRMEQATENGARAAIANMIAGVVTGGGTEQEVHLLTEYNAETGLSLTATTVMQPANFAPFMRWAYARIAVISDRMAERSTLYHTSLTGKPIMRHTPAEDQRLFMFSPALRKMDATVLSTTFNDNYLKQPYTEAVGFWQSIEVPDQIQVTPAYLAADGTITTAQAAVTVENVFAFLCDRDALGITLFDESVLASPLNPKCQYYNVFYHRNIRWWNSYSENAVCFLLD